MNIFSNSDDSNAFSLTNFRDTTSDFIQSNSMIAKLAFLLLALVVFILILRICVSILSWYYGPNNNPHFLDGMQPGNMMKQYVQDPKISGGDKTTIRSRDEDKGIEFTWSVWIYVDDITAGAGKYRHVFHKGDNPSSIGEDGIVYPNNAPGLYIAPNTNALRIVMNTFNDYNEHVDIPDLPLNKWVNVIIRCKNDVLDIYINGVITQSIQLNGVPKQNYGDVWMCANGGFSGYVSNLWYYSHALGASSIADLYKNGPNRKMVGTGGMEFGKPDYLSLRWYFYGNENMYNP
jgi:hypothetical protein